ncbi:DUF2293 domain-containing protein [Aspergillus foveolatus]|uniref:DUF2293 domain-containing protein n=1 Tax=Aspergillus foveolatus TaxID=210207 RepID=UPI003CCD8F96
MAPTRPKTSTKGRKGWGRGKNNHFESRAKRNRKIPRFGINRIERNRTERSRAERNRAERNQVEKGHAANSIAEKDRAEKQLPWRPPRPLAILAQKHELALSRKALFPKSRPTAANKKPKSVITKSRHGLAKYKLVTQWPSPEPLEMDNTGKKALGIRVPADVHAAVLRSAEETAESRANAVRARDERDLAHNRELLRKQFPLMPAQSLNTILQHAFLKGSGRVGRTTTTPEKEKVILAVEAHIRHVHTPYEALLRSGMPRLEARNKVREQVQTILAAWVGKSKGAEPQPTILSLRKRKE